MPWSEQNVLISAELRESRYSPSPSSSAIVKVHDNDHLIPVYVTIGFPGIVISQEVWVPCKMLFPGKMKISRRKLILWENVNFLGMWLPSINMNSGKKCVFRNKWISGENTNFREMWLIEKCEFSGNFWENVNLWEIWLPVKCEFSGYVTVTNREMLISWKKRISGENVNFRKMWLYDKCEIQGNDFPGQFHFTGRSEFPEKY